MRSPVQKIAVISICVSLLASLGLPAMAVSASALPGAIVIADEGNNRIVLVDANGKVQWTFPQKGDLAPGQSFKTPDDALMLPDGLQLVPDNAKANFPGLQ